MAFWDREIHSIPGEAQGTEGSELEDGPHGTPVQRENTKYDYLQKYGSYDQTYISCLNLTVMIQC